MVIKKKTVAREIQRLKKKMPLGSEVLVQTVKGHRRKYFLAFADSNIGIKLVRKNNESSFICLGGVSDIWVSSDTRFIRSVSSGIVKLKELDPIQYLPTCPIGK